MSRISCLQQCLKRQWSTRCDVIMEWCCASGSSMITNKHTRHTPAKSIQLPRSSHCHATATQYTGLQHAIRRSSRYYRDVPWVVANQCLIILA
ncbi:hypothetical protein SCLCIDRAFT_193464 [Scleroderma citrinum Foug A]|uniref:Uncharacterized protein n=1 Tax=Scleroderma citrinum Foug A TaxID=1036808 RepID=A0A0C3D8C0_9AGAM|nr:hypothetical protein SCLCIDRAFT_193464 [Scleroderma citrinum Foug A]